MTKDELYSFGIHLGVNHSSRVYSSFFEFEDIFRPVELHAFFFWSLGQQRLAPIRIQLSVVGDSDWRPRCSGRCF